jgi:Dyp-type peroxidase family
MMSESTQIDQKDIQAIFRGFGLDWPVGTFIFCRFDDCEAGRKLLRRIGPLTSFHDLKSQPDTCVNAALTYAGLDALHLGTEIMGSLPDDFAEGMQRRASINGDAGESDPSLWDSFWQGRQVHLWVGIYSRDENQLVSWISAFEKWIGETDNVAILGKQPVSRIVSSPEAPIYIDDEKSQPQKPVLLEHFGFRDGMGNPPIKGLVDTHVTGSGRLDTDGHWHSIAAGEFLLGHVDTNGEMPLAPKPEPFAHNGSFMVLRKLEQDVDLFRDYLKEQASKLETPADSIASKMVGRLRDGTPLLDAKDDFNFRFADDPEGRTCPMGAHIRRANPRDSFGADFGSLLVDRHRILRRAITYGKLVERGQKQQDINGVEGQGLMFVVLNASISRQFEFVQQQWVNYGNDFNQGNDRDPIVGLQTGGGQMVIPGDDDKKTKICDDLKQFVRCKGGDYFFLPGIRAFNAL